MNGNKMEKNSNNFFEITSKNKNKLIFKQTKKIF
jgi:hypothetical protein